MRVFRPINTKMGVSSLIIGEVNQNQAQKKINSFPYPTITSTNSYR